MHPRLTTAESNPKAVRPRPAAAFADFTLPYIPSLGGDFGRCAQKKADRNVQSRDFIFHKGIK